MAYPRTIRNFNAFLDGNSYFGKVRMGKLPNVKVKEAAYRGAGMEGEVGRDMGLEAMRAEAEFDEWDPNVLAKFGRRERLILRPAAMGEADFNADTLIATIGGRVMVNEPGDLKPGEEAPMKLEWSVDYYRLEINSREVYKIDLEAGLRVIDGVDQTASMRRAMGL